ncbi:hypothetical protein KUCAC02_012185 [Chaenocephalus aceratus]|uniref:Uncharacterized protein n=1 Tax=Chaenocephalus aceratus TaxID=36190 RepID=A0ACB9X9X6_CHAAC|nr:hypothetical protein KUCAC02_012185 [Chaenocephalus aceratus]
MGACSMVSVAQTYTQLGRLQEAHVGSMKCCVLSLTTVDRPNRRAHKCPFHTSLAWQRVRTPEGRLPPLNSPFEAHELLGFLVLIFETNPLEGFQLETRVLTSSKYLIWNCVLASQLL